MSFWYARQTLNALRPVGGSYRFHLIKSLCPLMDVVLVDESLTNEDMEQTICQGRVRTRGEAQMQCGIFDGRRAAGIYDNKLPSIAALGPKILHDRRHRLSRVASDEQNDLGL